MNISNGTMDIFFGYNMRVGDVNGLTESASRYAEMAKNAETPEERERYANAVTQINNDLLPKLKQEVDTLGKQLGLNSDDMGQAITKKVLEEKNDTKSHSLFEYLESGDPSYLSNYQPGKIFSKDI
jgi:hypothetical protein